jgi:hypothetical protein
VPYDPDLFRAYVDIRTCNATLVEVLARPGLAERMIEVASDHEPLRPPGPDREQLLALVA